mgnify:FL=1
MWNFNNFSKKILVFVVAFCLLLGCSRKNDDYYNRKGVNYINNGQHKFAISAFKTAIKINTSNTEAHFNLGRAYKRAGKDEQARTEFAICKRLNPNKYNEYVKKYREKIDYEIADTKNYGELGSAYAEKGMIDDAINAYKKSIDIEPDNARVHYSLGTLYAMKGKYSDAADEFWMAVEINPGMSEAHYNLGLSYFRQGMFDKAIAEYQTTLKLLPETQNKKRAGVHYKLGMAYEGSKVFDDAMHELEKAIALMPKDARIHHQLSVVYKKAGLFKKAKKEAKIYEKLRKGKTHH